MVRTEVRGGQILDGSVSLTADVTGTLPVGNGGSGAATLASNNVLLGNGTSALQVVAPGTAGNTLKSNGTTWISVADATTITSTASSATPSVTVTGNDQLNVTALAVGLTGITVSGSPQSGWKLIVRVKDNGTSRAFAPGSSFQNSDAATAPTATTVGKTHRMGYIYDEVVTKYVLAAVDTY